MELPRLRLRKVFEHGTHFKVQKPGGQSITIAKKGLSPGTIKRYQKLAHGGEVRGYDNGGEVTATGETVDQLERRLAAEQAELDRIAQQGATPAAQPVEAAPVALSVPRRVVASTATAPAATMREEVASLPPLPQQPRRMEARREALEAKEAAGELPGAAPAPAAAAPPAVVIVNNSSAPAAEPQAAAPKALTAEPALAAQTPAAPAPAPAPASLAASGPAIVDVPLAPPPAAAEAAVPVNVPAEGVQPVAPVRFDDVATVSGFQPLAAGAPAFTTKAKGFAAPSSLPGLASPLDIQQQPMAMPPLPFAAPAAVAPVAPIAATATTPLAAPLRIAPLTADRVSAAVRAEPNASLGDVVRKLVGPSMAQLVDVAAPEFSTIKASDVAGKDGLIKLLVGGFNNQINAAVAAGDAEAAEAQAQIAGIEAEEQRLGEKVARDEARRKELQSHADTLLREAESADDLKSFFESQGALKSIFSVVALAIGGALSGYTRTPNYVMQAFNNAMAADLEEQKRRRNSKWNRYKDVLGDAEAASDLVNADNALLASVALKKQAAKAGLQKIQPQVDAIIGKLQAQGAAEIARLDLRLAQAEDEREVAKPRMARPSAKGSGLPERRWEVGRTFNVGGIPVQSPSPQGMTNVRGELGRRNFAVKALDEALGYVESIPKGQGINALSQDRQKALVALAMQIEQFPQAFGYNRAVSKVAKEQLKEALDNPLGITGFFKELIGNVDIATGIRQLRNDAVSAREDFVGTHVDATSQRDKDAAKYGLWKLRSEEARLHNFKAPPMPSLLTPIAEIERLSNIGGATFISPAPAAAPIATPAKVAPQSGDWRSRARPLGELK